MIKDDKQIIDENQQSLDIVQDDELQNVVGGFEVKSAQLVGEAVAPDIIICVSGC